MSSAASQHDPSPPLRGASFAEDPTLVVAARHGDRDALERLLRLHQPRLHSLCRRLCHDPDDALDALQEALIAIVRGLPRFEGRSSFGTWAYRVTANACVDEVRRRHRRPVAVDTIDTDQRSAAADDPEQSAARADLDAALANLPIEFRAAVVLRDLCAFDYSEIAEILDIPPGTVRSRIARGRAALASALEPRQQIGNPPPPGERRTYAP